MGSVVLEKIGWLGWEPGWVICSFLWAVMIGGEAFGPKSLKPPTQTTPRFASGSVEITHGNFEYFDTGRKRAALALSVLRRLAKKLYISRYLPQKVWRLERRRKVSAPKFPTELLLAHICARAVSLFGLLDFWSRKVYIFEIQGAPIILGCTRNARGKSRLFVSGI